MPTDDLPENTPLDATAFHQLFVQNQRRVFGYILTLLPRLSDAEEVFQQTCVVLLGKAAQFVPGTEFVSWACQVAKYEAYNYRRRQVGQVYFSEGLLDRIAARRLERAEALDAELDALRRCVEVLPPSDRELIRRRYGRRVTSRALAVELGRSENTVYKAIRRIRRSLRECVERTIARGAHAGAVEADAIEVSPDLPGQNVADGRRTNRFPGAEGHEP